MSFTRWRRAVLALAVVAALGGAAGCVSIPTSGPVQAGLSSFEEADQTVQFTPSGPTEGSSQEDIVRGFVQAATSSLNDYGVAREFLTPEYAREWEANTGVLVDAGSRQYRASGEAGGVLSVSAIATVDARGTLTPVEPGRNTEVSFRFAEVDGEWRIAEAPAGIVLDQSTFQAIWAPHTLYFIGPNEMLVPDTRWFVSRSTLATEMVLALINGPSARLEGAVRSSVPTGAALRGGSVELTEGRAQVDLSGDIFDGNISVGAEIAEQVRASLQSVPEVTEVDVLIDGTLLQLPPGLSDDGGLRSLPTVGAPPVLSNGIFGPWSGGEVRSMGELGERIAATRPTAAVLNPEETTALVVNAAGVQRLSEEETVSVSAQTDVLSPSLDSLGWAWVVPVSSPEDVAVVSEFGERVNLEVPWLAGRDVRSLRVSPDGSQVAALVRDGVGSEVLVAGILRDTEGAPTGTTEPSNAGWTTGEPIDLDWTDADGVGVLSQLGESSRVISLGLGQFSVDRGAVVKGRQISGGSGGSQLRVLDDDGDLWVGQGSGWQSVASEVQLIATHG